MKLVQSACFVSCLFLLASPAVAAAGEPLVAHPQADDAAILLPTDPPAVQRARRDALLDVRRRYAPYSGAEMGGLVDMSSATIRPWIARPTNRCWRRSVASNFRTKPSSGRSIKHGTGRSTRRTTALGGLFRYTKRLTPESKQAIEELGGRRCSPIAKPATRPKWRSDGAWYWTHADASIGSNWGLIAAEACILGGQVAGRPDFVAHGKQALRTLVPLHFPIRDDQPGMQPHGRPLADLFVRVGVDRRVGRRSRHAALARLLLERIWLEKLIYFHPPTLRECGASGALRGGPQRRAHRGNQSTDVAEHAARRNGSLHAAAGDDRPRAQRMAVVKQEEPYLVSSWRIPGYLQELALRKTLPQVVRSTCDVEVPPLGGTYPPQHPPLYPNPQRGRWQSNELYTYLTESFALGSMSRAGGSTWACPCSPSGRPMTAGRKASATTAPLYFRYQHDDRKPFGKSTAILRDRQVELPLQQGWAEYGRHAAMQDHGRAIVRIARGWTICAASTPCPGCRA